MFNINFQSVLKRIFGNEKQARVVDTRADLTPKPYEKELELETPVILTIWTIERSRYVPARAICTDIEVYPSDAMTLCEGVSGYVVGTPNGETVVVEARAGGLVGHSIEVVMDGIREMTASQLINQIDSGKKEFNRMKKQEMSNDEFWKSIKMGREEVDAAQDF